MRLKLSGRYIATALITILVANLATPFLSPNLYAIIDPNLQVLPGQQFGTGNLVGDNLVTRNDGTITAQGGSLLNDNIVTAQDTVTRCNSANNEPFAILEVRKLVSDPRGLATTAQENNLRFTIEIVNNGVSSQTVLPESSGVRHECINIDDGAPFEVREVGPLSTNFEFGVPARTGTCNLTAAEEGQNYVCIIINEITGTEGIIEPIQPPPTPETSLPGVGQEQFSTVTAQAGQSSGAGNTLGLTNPPFDVCMSNTVDANVITTSRGVRVGTPTSNNVPELVRAPNSVTYTAGGKVNLDDVMQALQTFNTKSFTIRIFSDIDFKDQVPLAMSAPQFIGQIVVQDKSGANHEVENFDLFKIRTECKYITVAKAAEKAPRNNVFPLGVLSTNKDTSPPEITELLLQEKENLLASLDPANTSPFVLNPPFAVCDIAPAVLDVGNTARKASDDDIAIYNIKGEVKNLNSVSGNNLNMELNVDLNLRVQDQAKITDNNNPFMRVNLVADEDEDSAHTIPFTIHDLWTDCKDLALNNEFLFEPIQSEIDP